jgi:hypothetical protein
VSGAARVLPLFVVMFVANYIDRVNVGFVRSHLEADLGIGAAAFGLGAGLFFVGYAIFRCRRTCCCSATARAPG